MDVRKVAGVAQFLAAVHHANKSTDDTGLGRHATNLCCSEVLVDGVFDILVVHVFEAFSRTIENALSHGNAFS